MARVLYIGGYSRSGTTLLARLLGQLPGAVAVGELFDVWNRSYRQNQLCGCGRPFLDCPFWHEVTSRAFGTEPRSLDAGAIQAQARRARGTASVPMLWIPSLRSSAYRRDLATYARTLERLYGAIAEVSGARWIVDSSKEPHQAWVLREATTVDLHVVHQVRDSRAVAFSWRRRKPRPEIHWQPQEMDRFPLGRSAFEWDIHNSLVATRRSSLASYIRIRYEDLVSDPRLVLAAIGRRLGETWDVEQVVRGSEISVEASHTASGNPSRFEVGTVSIRPDDEWVSAMSTRDKVLVTALTAPGLLRYGYRLGFGASSESARPSPVAVGSRR